MSGEDPDAPEKLTATSPPAVGKAQRVDTLFRQGVTAAKAGHRRKARFYLLQVTSLNPRHEQAWLWLAGTTDDPKEALTYLAEALTLNPGNEVARAGLRWNRARAPNVGQSGPGGSLSLPPHIEGSPQPHTGTSLSVKPVADHPSPSPPPSQATQRGRTILFWALSVTLAISLLGGVLLVTGAGAGAWPYPTATLLPTSTSTPTAEQIIASMQPELDEAWQREDWLRAIDILEEMWALDASYPGLRERLYTAHISHGQALAESDQLGLAISHFDQALATQPGDVTAERARTSAANYLAGVQSAEDGNWEQAVSLLAVVFGMNPEYKDVRSLLYHAHLNLGLAQQAADNLVAAQAEYEMALQIVADGQEAQTQLAEVARLLAPPTPTPVSTPTSISQNLSGKRIEVDVSEQHFYAWEGDTLVYSFVCSTGEPGRPTAIGTWHVQSKIPMAYASTWNLKMPYWLGIYWAGPLENGIHALPILSSGQKLWEGYLGQRVSYGCIILSTEDAKTIYDWAEIGTPVIIRP